MGPVESEEPLYDEGEGYCEGDPRLEDMTPEELERLVTLQRQRDALNAIEDPDERRAANEAWLRELYG